MRRRATPAKLVVIKCTLILVLVGLSPTGAFAQDEAWINYFTVDDVPVGGDEDLVAVAQVPSRLRDTTRGNGWINALRRELGALLWRRPSPPAARVNLHAFGDLRFIESRSPLRVKRSVVVVPAGSSLATFTPSCSGGARSGNPDADITIYVSIYLEGSGLIFFAQARGYMPSAVASGVVETVPYPRWIECIVSASDVYVQARGTVIPDCGDARTDIMREYYDPQLGVIYKPTCEDFASSGDSPNSNFSWSELNGGFSNGNPHDPWGIVTQSLKDNLEQTRTNYNRGGIRLSSGYRCPHGNRNADGVAQSIHMQGRAADMYSSSHVWTEAEFTLLREAAQLTSPVQSFFWDTYTDHHYHAAWN